MENRKLTLAIDFDNTIAKTDYPHIKKIKRNAVKYINKLYDKGCLIIINTCRANGEKDIMCKFLTNVGLKYHYINENDPVRIRHYRTDTRKISADIYIDDKNLGGIPSWKWIYKLIKDKYLNDAKDKTEQEQESS